MLNNVILVGRVVEEPKLINMDTGYKVTNILLAIQKPFRNENNEQDVDFIPIQAWMKLSEIICDYVGKGSILGCKCRLQTRIVEVGDLKLKSIDVVAENISFISIKPRSDKVPLKNKEEEFGKDDPPEGLVVGDKVINNEIKEEKDAIAEKKKKKN